MEYGQVVHPLVQARSAGFVQEKLKGKTVVDCDCEKAIAAWLPPTDATQTVP